MILAQYDRKIGLYYLQARYYDPAQGRFISRDRWDGEQETPLTQNKYIYAVNSPANFIDPTGEKFSFSKIASRARSAVSKARSVVKSVSGISKSKRSKGVSNAANRAVAAVKKAAKSLKGRINNTVKLSVSMTKNNTSKAAAYVREMSQSARLVNSLNKAGGLKSSNNILAKATQLVRKTCEAVKNLSQTNKFVDRFSAGSKLVNTLAPMVTNLKNIKNIGFGSNVKNPAPGIRFELPGEKPSIGRAIVEEKKVNSNIIRSIVSNAVNVASSISKWSYGKILIQGLKTISNISKISKKPSLVASNSLFPIFNGNNPYNDYITNSIKEMFEPIIRVAKAARAPDYYTFSAGVDSRICPELSLSPGVFTVDRNGNIYRGVSASLGLGLPITGNATTGWLLSWEKPSESDLMGFIEGQS